MWLERVSIRLYYTGEGGIATVWKWKDIRTFIAAGVIEQFVWSYIPVWGPTVFVTILAYAQARPWDILVMMALGTFAISVIGMNHFVQWRDAKTPKNKLQFQVPMISKVIPDLNAIPLIHSIKLGITLNNLAPFPMEFIIEDVRSRIGNNIDTRPKDLTSVHKINSRGRIGHTDFGIALGNSVVPDGHLEGDFYIKIKYGHPKKPKFEVASAYAVLFSFDGRGDIRNADFNSIDPESYLQGVSNVTWTIPEPRRSA